MHLQLKKVPVRFLMSAHVFICLFMSAYISTALTGHIYVEFDTGDFYENLS
jgi:hypothetical protein